MGNGREGANVRLGMPQFTWLSASATLHSLPVTTDLGRLATVDISLTRCCPTTRLATSRVVRWELLRVPAP